MPHILSDILGVAQINTWIWVTIGSGNGLSPIWCQAITWINVDLLLIGSTETNFSRIQI